MASTVRDDVAPSGPLVSSAVEQGDSPIERDHFVLSGGLRQVKPYLFDFICTVKPRFSGSKIVDFMASEFPSMPRYYYARAARAGRLRQVAGSGSKKSGVSTDGKSKRQLAREAKRARAEGGSVAAAGEERERRDGGAEDVNVPLVDNATIRHLLHRHEPPSLDLPVRVLGRCPESGLWAVGKPPGVPVHAAGGYRKNTVCGLLEADARAAGRGPPDSSRSDPSISDSDSDLVVPWPAYLHPLHRLDKPVSGVLLFADGGDSAEKCRAQLADKRSVSKVYVARVLGTFPSSFEDLRAPEEVKRHVVAGDDGGEEGGEESGRRNRLLTVDVALSWDSAGHRARCSAGSGPKFFSGPPSPSDASPPPLSGRAGAPRTAATSFRLLSSSPDGRTSVVECRPLTGRTHQIRAHLGFLGHPIANDALYYEEGEPCPYPGPERPRLEAHGGEKGSGAGGAGCFVSESEKREGGSEGTNNEYISAEDVAELLRECGWCERGGEVRREREARGRSPSPSLSPLEAETLEACPFCPSLSRPAAACELRPLWLHARLYEGEKEGGGRWKFECPVPRWASDEFVPRAKR